MENFKWSFKVAISLLFLGEIGPDKWQYRVQDLCDIVE